ncbi:hypothetical protein BX616_001540 [Lobosporangium transversale]|uniref:Cytidyltransferase-like domain-containing protein n=1 Tax=Lobosporangium transversale TaxID=64571 RepID=A0A1Y2GHT6_9FUNG|nr:hypothetical protein BCR41DRAFT_372189 [Lobosporangium transversale]KAF9903782.1 hypothetical protein BX616_001540 [Lobosporangium transversale]ORZ11369.1 hypothetical protein BCR41DRAFT_372189 [Lobosporangium transversale]|eukprot:XP_021879684.1 hypothetical protein BCR41DRAFT_372189 [Lobosporangium transversale]
MDRPPSTERPTRIAILDSSFNPPTKAHYHLLKAAARVGCDAVLLLLATNNVDKGQTGAGAVERLEMMEAMAMDSISNDKEDPALRQIAVGLTTHARFMDKAQPILDQYEPNTVQLSWIMGHDTMTRLFDPKYYNDVHADMAPFFEKCDVICSSRPGHGSREEMMRFVEQSGHKDKVTLVDIIETEEVKSSLPSTVASTAVSTAEKRHGIEIREISSTIVRDAVKNKDWLLVERCVQPSVREIIEKNSLYAS